MGRRIVAATPNNKRNVPLIDLPTGGGTSAAVTPAKAPPTKVTVQVDPVNEIVVISACAQDPKQLERYGPILFTDHFLVREHADAWAALRELRRQKLAYSPETIEVIAGKETAEVIERLVMSVPSPDNLPFHVTNLLWDKAKSEAVQGPLNKLLEQFRDPIAEPSDVRLTARSLLAKLEGFQERQWVHDPEQLVRDQMRDIEQRIAGRAVYSYGIEGLDFYDKKFEADGSRERRMIPGTAPGQITCVTAISGGGKSTFTANVALGLARLQRRVLWGAWEMRGGMSLELLACISLGWSRSEMQKGIGPIRTPEGRAILRERMLAIGQYVRFLKNPFRRQVGDKSSNEKNLDLLHGILSEERPDVFIADLWKRCLVDDDPKKEEDALIRQQMMAEDLEQHHILLQQQRLKDIEARADKKPTREGIKGTGAWVEVPDSIIGLHRPALWKRVEDNKLLGIILKQRYGLWPLAIEFEWFADLGVIKGGRAIDYDHPGEAGNEVDAFTAAGSFLAQRPGKGKKR